MEKEYLRLLIMNGTFKIATIVLVFLASFLKGALAQEKDTLKVLGIIEKGDTIIHKNLREIIVLPQHEFKNARQERRYNRYVERVKKVYPYAKLAGELLQEYEPRYLALDDDRDRRRMMKDIEKQLMDEYEDDLRRMTISEGRILLKLIDRETRRTSYILIKEFRGGVPAFFWQGIARLFGSDLKSEYDPAGEDRMLEQIVSLIEVGYL